MSYPLSQKPCEAAFSLANNAGILTIENGIEGTTNVVKSTVLMTSGCDEDVVCGDQIKRTIPDLVHLYGDYVDCVQKEEKHIVLNPVNFGYTTAQELIDAINAL